ncbi:MAG: GSCFA domain-containing protein [Pseudomonadota bacterium]
MRKYKPGADTPKKPGALHTVSLHGANAIYHDRVEGAEESHSPWFRGKRRINKNPDMTQMVAHTASADFVVQGWAPDAPAIDKDTRITAFGSCFAANISKWLGKRNYRVSTKDPDAQNAYVVRIGEGMVNSFVIRQQFEWAWENKTFDEPLWHGYDKEVYGYDESVRTQTKALFDNTDVFILTFGLSEVWYDAQTDNVFWRSVPKQSYDPERHLFRVSSVEENRDNIDAIYQLIRKHRPDAKIIITLSPIPLIATFRDESCITANSVSKSILRVAIDDVMCSRKAEGYLHYWPSYELVMDVFRAPFQGDRRHIDPLILDFIMTQFEHVWCVNEDNNLPSLLEAWVRARVAAGFLPKRLGKLVEKRMGKRILEFIEKPMFNDVGDAEASRILLQALVADWERADART